MANYEPPSKGKSKSAIEDSPFPLEIKSRLARAGKGMRPVIGDGKANEVNQDLVKLTGEAFAIREKFLNGSDDSIEAMSRRMGLSKGYLTAHAHHIPCPNYCSLHR